MSDFELNLAAAGLGTCMTKVGDASTEVEIAHAIVAATMSDICITARPHDDWLVVAADGGRIFSER